MMSKSVLFYVQHLLGIGHIRRALQIVEALAHESIGVILVTGGEPVVDLERASVEKIVQLPPIRARDAGFKELVDAAGRPIDDEVRNARRAALLAAFADGQPDAILIEAFPFGRRAFRFELNALIAAARSRDPRPLVLCSLRDIVVVQTDAQRRREIADRVRADFDSVLVHGDPGFIPLEASFPEADDISDRLVYTGYVTEADGAEAATDSDETVGEDEVVVSVGGGAVGGALLTAAIETRRRGYLRDVTWRLLAGPNLPEAEFVALADSRPDGVVLERYRPDFRQLLRRCRVSVSQAGYNTILDILVTRAPAVVVPFATERETEQSLRAERLAARAVLELLRESEVSPERLALTINRAICSRRAEIAIDTGGARRTAAVIAQMLRSPGRPPDFPAEGRGDDWCCGKLGL